MNNCDERIEKTLNQAGQTISDLPRKQGESISEPYSGEDCQKANGTAWRWYLNVDTDMDDYDSTRSKYVLKQYILHLTDVIDRMETALENVCGERDYLLKEYLGCESCTVGEGARFDEEPCLSCENRSEFEWSIPEDWSVDDE